MVLDGVTHEVTVVSPGTQIDIPDVHVDYKAVPQPVLPPYAFAPKRGHHFEIAGCKTSLYSSLVDLQIRAYDLVVNGKHVDHPLMPAPSCAHDFSDPLGTSLQCWVFAAGLAVGSRWGTVGPTSLDSLGDPGSQFIERVELRKWKTSRAAGKLFVTFQAVLL